MYLSSSVFLPVPLLTAPPDVVLPAARLPVLRHTGPGQLQVPGQAWGERGQAGRPLKPPVNHLHQSSVIGRHFPTTKISDLSTGIFCSPRTLKLKSSGNTWATCSTCDEISRVKWSGIVDPKDHRDILACSLQMKKNQMLLENYDVDLCKCN